uniref:Uncharacterized protein n=1 Tax=Vespula pensylvanica TaxID=30213 RepID=A0A834UDG8_VESPE|nr:hypothetical protein H0235_005258 [Vespula pensylvanica]
MAGPGGEAEYTRRAAEQKSRSDEIENEERISTSDTLAKRFKEAFWSLVFINTHRRYVPTSISNNNSGSNNNSNDSNNNNNNNNKDDNNNNKEQQHPSEGSTLGSIPHPFFL